MKKLKDILFEPDDYDGITWFDFITAGLFSPLPFLILGILVHIFC